MLLLLLLLLPPAHSKAMHLTPSPHASETSASNPLSPSFAGFGIETSNLFAFTGGPSPNAFSLQLLTNLAAFSGAPPHIRLGGNTQDYMLYDASYPYYAWEWNAESTAQGVIAADAIRFGPAFFEALDRFPQGTPVTFGLNLADEADGYLERIVGTAEAAMGKVKNVRIASFEIGNEADLYLQNGMRSGGYGGAAYTQEFLTRAKEVYERVLRPRGLPSEFFEPPATASTIGNSFEIAQLVEVGLIKENEGRKYVSGWNQHDYLDRKSTRLNSSHWE